MNLLRLLAILDSAFQSFLAAGSHRGADVGSSTFPNPWFAGDLTAGIFALVTSLLNPFETRPVPVLFS